MNPVDEKRDAYVTAQALLQKQDEASLRYAALELRRCLEAIVYEKLDGYRQFLPAEAAKEWRPGQAFDALIAIEPNAEDTFTLAVAVETSPGQMAPGPYRIVGVDKRPKAKWIKKTWNKLGGRLHAEWPYERHKKSELSQRQFLERTLTEVAPFVENSVTSVMAMTIDFQCTCCGATVKVMEQTLKQKSEAVCLNCWSSYRAEGSVESVVFYPNDDPFQCNCGHEIRLRPKEIEAGYRFPCPECKQVYAVVGSIWNVSPIEEIVTEGPLGQGDV